MTKCPVCKVLLNDSAAKSCGQCGSDLEIHRQIIGLANQSDRKITGQIVWPRALFQGAILLVLLVISTISFKSWQATDQIGRKLVTNSVDPLVLKLVDIVADSTRENKTLHQEIKDLNAELTKLKKTQEKLPEDSKSILSNSSRVNDASF